MKTLFQSTLAFCAIFLFATACIQDEFDKPSNIDAFNCLDDAWPIDSNSIYRLKADFIASGESELLIEDDYFIEGIVISSDKAGNYFKALIIQQPSATTPQNQPIGMRLNIDQTDLSSEYAFGRKVYVNLKGLTISLRDNSIEAGLKSEFSGDVERIPSSMVDEFLGKGPCNRLEEIIIPEFTIDELRAEEGALTQFLGSYVNTRVALVDVEVTDGFINSTYADAENEATVNVEIQDCNGSTLILRNSGFADFAGDILPFGKGRLEGNYNVFGSDLQIFINDVTDLNFSDTRCDGSQQSDLPFYHETFNTEESRRPTQTPGWTNFTTKGDVSWEGGAFGPDVFVQVSGFGSNSDSSTAWWISPDLNLDTTDNEVLTFRTIIGFDDNGTDVADLTLLISTDYEPGTNPDGATWTEYEYNKPVNNSGGSFGDWVPSGDIDVSALSGNINIGFRYDGGSDFGANATYEVDDVKLREDN